MFISILAMLLAMLGGGGSAATVQAKPMVNVFPNPGTWTASNRTTLSFRGVRKKNLGRIQVIGSRSGRHGGRLRNHPDGDGVSFLPNRWFARGEKVRIRTRQRIRGARNGAFWIRIGRFYGSEERPTPQKVKAPKGTLKSRPDLAPPELTVNVFTSEVSKGKLFYAPKDDGLTIADRAGRTQWFQPTSYGGYGSAVYDFRAQRYRGRPVLTFWKGSSTVIGYSQTGGFEILNRNYKRIARVTTGNGYKPDIHEFRITGRNTALVLAYRGVLWDARKFGGSRNTPVLDNVVQEVDIRTGLVLFEWHSLGNVSVGESVKGVPKGRAVWDYFHVNSVNPDRSNTLLISARATSSIYRLSRRTGRLLWAMRGSGKRARNHFRMGKGTSFAYQHDAIRLPNGNISLFDNGSGQGMPTVNKQSSGLILKLAGRSRKALRATLVKRNVHQPNPLPAPSQGSAQVLSGNRMFVGWGELPVMTEFGPNGNVTFNAKFPETKKSSYRAYKLPWNGIAPGRPAIASKAGSGDGGTVWASWNGATNVASWRVITTAGDGKYRILTTAPWTDLETAIPVSEAFDQKIAVQAIGYNGKVLKTSAVVAVGRQAR